MANWIKAIYFVVILAWVICCGELSSMIFNFFCNSTRILWYTNLTLSEREKGTHDER